MSKPERPRIAVNDKYEIEITGVTSYSTATIRIEAEHVPELVEILNHSAKWVDVCRKYATIDTNKPVAIEPSGDAEAAQ